jgi:hypothetical protein
MSGKLEGKVAFITGVDSRYFTGNQMRIDAGADLR